MYNADAFSRVTLFDSLTNVLMLLETIALLKRLASVPLTAT